MRIFKDINLEELDKMDYRDFAIELVEEGLLSNRKLLIACLKYMPQDDVKAMLKLNEYLTDEEEE